MMTCKRCGCTQERPCPGGCSWSLSDVCSRCTTADERRIEQQYASLFENLRAELEQNRFERFLLAVSQGMAANPAHAELSGDTRAFVARSFKLALALSEASAPEVDDVGDEPRITVVGRQIVLP